MAASAGGRLSGRKAQSRAASATGGTAFAAGRTGAGAATENRKEVRRRVGDTTCFATRLTDLREPYSQDGELFTPTEINNLFAADVRGYLTSYGLSASGTLDEVRRRFDSLDASLYRR